MKPKVFFSEFPEGSSVEQQLASMEKLYNASGVSELVKEGDFTAVKVHVGEQGNVTYMNPKFAALVVARAKQNKANVFLTETSTLYKSERDDAVSHILHAAKHGFSIENIGAPFIMADGLFGGHEADVEINGELCKSVKVAADIVNVDFLFVISHATGHMVTGLGAAIKNIGMGLASRKGKLRQHSKMKPSVNASSCTYCRKCMPWCPVSAISTANGKAFIDSNKCIGCGECLTLCRFSAINFDWGAESEFTQKFMAEHALGVVKNKQDKCMFFNLLVNMTAECDCYNHPQKKILPDVGILASTDPVAIDKATLDLTDLMLQAEKHSMSPSFGNLDPMIQLRHGQKIGLGSLDYELVRL